MKTKIPYKILSKGEIRALAILELEWRGVKCWINNNVAIRGRKFIGEPGVPDIAGYMKFTGVAVYCEVKALGDRLSDDQVIFLTDLRKAGGFAFVALQDKYTGQFMLIKFEP